MRDPALIQFTTLTTEMIRVYDVFEANKYVNFALRLTQNKNMLGAETPLLFVTKAELFNSIQGFPKEEITPLYEQAIDLSIAQKGATQNAELITLYQSFAKYLQQFGNQEDVKKLTTKAKELQDKMGIAHPKRLSLFELLVYTLPQRKATDEKDLRAHKQ